jgi:hypothetical protein
MLYLPISRRWLFSPAAQRIYLGCAVLTFALVATLVGVNLAMPLAGAASLNPTARLVVKVLLLPEILGTALLWIAMWYHWFSFDQSHYFKKFLFFLLLFFVAPFGTLFYYFVAYRRNVLHEQARSSLVPTS